MVNSGRYYGCDFEKWWKSVLDENFYNFAYEIESKEGEGSKILDLNVNHPSYT